jgi:hypothetical protein
MTLTVLGQSADTSRKAEVLHRWLIEHMLRPQDDSRVAIRLLALVLGIPTSLKLLPRRPASHGMDDRGLVVRDESFTSFVTFLCIAVCRAA